MFFCSGLICTQILTQKRWNLVAYDSSLGVDLSHDGGRSRASQNGLDWLVFAEEACDLACFGKADKNVDFVLESDVAGSCGQDIDIRKTFLYLLLLSKLVELELVVDDVFCLRSGLFV